ncbi:uncharacterized protein B0H64DRAFT_8571 [Chaetomium fimeti]|uniref:Uncharacterized protein n=1 Tax=Chaetomium fimeti TaxID=1854472 RepID=A0AAE0HP63_9PEZI|nr:hypothetical protein B0H64DRAFT_8571 [Chaetomium fimeti]
MKPACRWRVKIKSRSPGLLDISRRHGAAELVNVSVQAASPADRNKVESYGSAYHRDILLITLLLSETNLCLSLAASPARSAADMSFPHHRVPRRTDRGLDELHPCHPSPTGRVMSTARQCQSNVNACRRVGSLRQARDRRPPPLARPGGTGPDRAEAHTTKNQPTRSQFAHLNGRAARPSVRPPATLFSFRPTTHQQAAALTS